MRKRLLALGPQMFKVLAQFCLAVLLFGAPIPPAAFVVLAVALQLFLELALEQVGAVVPTGFAQFLDLPFYLVQALLELGVFAAMLPFAGMFTLLPVLSGMMGQFFSDVAESPPRFLAQMVDSILCHLCSAQVLLQLGAFLLTLRCLSFDLQTDLLQFQLKDAPSQFVKMFHQCIGLDLGQLGFDLAAQVFVMLGLGQSGFAVKQDGQRQPGDDGGKCLFSHDFGE